MFFIGKGAKISGNRKLIAISPPCSQKGNHQGNKWQQVLAKSQRKDKSSHTAGGMYTGAAIMEASTELPHNS